MSYSINIPMSVYIYVRQSAEPCMFCLETDDVLESNMPCRCRIHVHPLCLNTWLAAETSCPLCRQHIASDVQHGESGESGDSSEASDPNQNVYMYGFMLCMTLLVATVVGVYFYINPL
jgi:regulator of replication initiation timing